MFWAHVATLVCAVCATSCAADPDRPPIARLTASPAAIFVHDDFRTQITLDGRMSASFDGPDTPLAYRWRFDNDEARTDDALDAPTLVVTFRGDRPPRIVLTVTAPDGLEDTVTSQLPLTVRE